MKKTKLQKLVLDETIEISIVAVYTIGLALAFYGPNQAIFSQLQVSKSFEDFNAFKLFMVMFLMGMFEIFGSMICGFILQTFCHINLFNEFSDLMRNFWFIVAIRLSWTLFSHFSGNDLNLGIDDDFEWISDEGRRRIILDISDLTNEEKILLLNDKTSL